MRRLLFSVTIKDCKVQTFAAGGPGGQHQNRIRSGVRIIHPPSGARGEARDSRDQLTNKRSAFVRMCKTKEFEAWHKDETQRRLGKLDLEARVEAEMKPWHLKTETKDEDGRWKEDLILPV